MRNDMNKVIVERPRGWKSNQATADRRRNDFEGPRQLGMRAGLGHRALNENLKPLKRFLHAQVGRPWNKVHQEISSGIDRRNTVQLHVLAHLDEMIAVQVEVRDGELVDLKDRWHRHGHQARGLRQELYVDPRTGLIRINKSYRSWATERREERQLENARIASRFRRIDADTRLMLLEGEWYEVRMADVPPAREIEVVHSGSTHRCQQVTWVYDVVLKRKVCARFNDETTHQRRELYRENWRKNRYAVSKRQLSRREITLHDLPRATTNK